MSEVLLVVPAPLVGAAGESVSLFSTFSSQVGSAASTSAGGAPDCHESPAALSLLQEQERHQRAALMLEFETACAAVLKWRGAMEVHQAKQLLRRRADEVSMQEAVLQHRMFRLAHLEQRFGMLPAGGSLSCRALLQDEFFEREYVALQQTREMSTIWLEYMSMRLRVDATAAVTPPALPQPTYMATDERYNSVRSRLTRVRRQLAHVCDAAEVLSFTLDHEVTQGLRATVSSSDNSSSNHTTYPVAVMQSAVQQIDELRGRLYTVTEKQRETEQMLRSTRRMLTEEKERAAQLQRVADATEEAAAEVASQCHLRLPKREPHVQHDGAPEAQQEAAPETYTTRVLQELRRTAVTLAKEVEWQGERIQRELRGRDAVLGVVCDKVAQLSELVHQTRGVDKEATSGSVKIGNIAVVLDDAIAGLLCLRNNKSSMNQVGAQTLPQPLPENAEIASLKEMVANMRATIEFLSREKSEKDVNTNNASSVMRHVPDTDYSTDVLTMALRRLEEERSEKLQLERVLEERRGRQPSRGGPSSLLGPAAAAGDAGVSHEDTLIQSVHRLREANTLLQDELKLEREAVESLRVKLGDAERFMRELQKQCRRLRQSGRFDTYEVVEQSGSDEDDDDDDDSGTDSEGDGGGAPAPRDGRVEDALGGVPLSNEWWAGRRHRSSSSSISGSNNSKDKDELAPSNAPFSGSSPSSAASCSLASLHQIAQPLFLLPREQQRTCLRDQRQLAATLRGVHGLFVCTLAMSKERHRSRCDLHDVANAFVGCGVSLHAFFRTTGPSAQLARHVAVLYPLPPALAHRLPAAQLLQRLKRCQTAPHRGTSIRSNESAGVVQLFDLREELQSAGKYLRGCMDLCLSQDGRFLYALTSADADAVARLCAPDCLDIPANRRFRFCSSLVEGKAGTGGRSNSNSTGEADGALPMDMLGWCGRGGICAWAMECMHFETPAEELRFERHLRSEYRLVMRLTAKEVRSFVGGSVELLGLTPVGKVVPRLFMSVAAFEALTPGHRVQLLQWYGGQQGVSVLSVGNIERLTGAPLRRFIAVVQWHGRVPLSKTPPQETLKLFGIQKS
ncbi:hypothetical protein DQ04_02211070 [Trypanosoma grayi]|uniref:hypothetical protein n=1 Tax=Trypanosoma grayi TaxID=71804 RepID=UPI0004F3FD72|nr:hypothetical protein DQ04_02211070 [Trypanosoma grayi]KEG11858.1 hypothetical protein DQ04_02211070 [Trypanosoma grayi]